MTKEGKKVWKLSAETFEPTLTEDKETWIVEENAANRHIKIFANNKQLLDKALASWQKINPTKKIISESKHEKENALFKPKYYEEEIPGYMLEFRYE